MKLPDRLLRTGAAFVVFGLITAVLPNSGIASVRADDCSSGSNPWKIIDPIAIVGGGFGIYELATGALHTGAGGGTIIAGGKKKSDNTESNSDWDKLHDFVNDSGPQSYSGQ